MDITDFDRMEQEAVDRLFEQNDKCPKCGREMINNQSERYGEYKHCNNCGKNWKLQSEAPKDNTDNSNEAIAFGDWLRRQRPDVFYGFPTTKQLFENFKKQ